MSETTVVIPLLLVAGGLVLLVAGGETMLRGAVGLATILRLTPAVIGLTVVAAGTSVPELAVSMIASVQGSADIAVANVVGSNIFNITVIIGLCALIRPLPITGNTIRLEYPVLALVTFLAIVIAHDGIIDRLEGILCIAVYAGFTAYLVSLVRGQATETETQGLRSEVKELSPSRRAFWISTSLVVAGIALLGAGAHATVAGAVDLARILGWSERVIGLTIVSAGTGLPEVVTSIVSSIRGRSDLAIGNVIGSNLFNTLGILGIGSLVSPLTVQAGLLATDIWWMLGITLLLFPVMFSGLRVSRWEGAVMLLTYGVYLTLLLLHAAPAS